MSRHIVPIKCMYVFFLFILTCVGSIISCKSQSEKTLIETHPITDYSNIPIYSKLVQDKNGIKEWKEQYAYLDSVEISRITYWSDGLKIKGFVAKPKAKGKYPCIVYNRGGNRSYGELKVAHAIWRLARFAKEGYFVIESQYREGLGSEGKDEFGGRDVNDVINLIDVLKEAEGADTEKIGMYGWSRGGMMTYIAMTKSDDIDVAVVGGAISDMFESIADRPKMESGVLADLIPDYYSNKEEELIKRSAVHWADQFPDNVPILMLHGNADWRVKSSQSLKLALEFDKFRIPYKLIIYEGGDHGLKEHRSDVDDEVLKWFDKYLKEDMDLPNMEYHGN